MKCAICNDTGFVDLGADARPCTCQIGDEPRQRYLRIYRNWLRAGGTRSADVEADFSEADLLSIGLADRIPKTEVGTQLAQEVGSAAAPAASHDAEAACRPLIDFPIDEPIPFTVVSHEEDHA